MTSRRGFLGSILALAASPAIVRAESLMPVRQIILPAGPIAGDVFTIDGVAGQFVVTGRSAGGLLTTTALTREALRMAKLSFIGSIDREYASAFASGGRIKLA